MKRFSFFILYMLIGVTFSRIASQELSPEKLFYYRIKGTPETGLVPATVDDLKEVFNIPETIDVTKPSYLSFHKLGPSKEIDENRNEKDNFIGHRLISNVSQNAGDQSTEKYGPVNVSNTPYGSVYNIAHSKEGYPCTDCAENFYQCTVHSDDIKPYLYLTSHGFVVETDKEFSKTGTLKKYNETDCVNNCLHESLVRKKFLYWIKENEDRKFHESIIQSTYTMAEEFGYENLKKIQDIKIDMNPELGIIKDYTLKDLFNAFAKENGIRLLLQNSNELKELVGRLLEDKRKFLIEAIKKNDNKEINSTLLDYCIHANQIAYFCTKINAKYLLDIGTQSFIEGKLQHASLSMRNSSITWKDNNIRNLTYQNFETYLQKKQSQKITQFGIGFAAFLVIGCAVYLYKKKGWFS